MKRPWLILIGGLLLAVMAYGGTYLACSARSRRMASSPAPELSWLKTEFHVSDAEFARVEDLHASYLAACEDRCRQIDALNGRLRMLLAQTNAVTPEIDAALQDAARLRAECQKAMIGHFYEISRSMPPDQGQRYFAWMIDSTFGSEHASMTRMTPAAPDAHHEHHAE